ncbi:hypothetical protein SISSUDRAFT_1046556 [Sistotremastrum suecicum HHB10207 ss-3]|uniref:Peptidase A2 domain-containing protein n=1 Tax=Sistotremastrum suecicum HHB10207 ss-3 TaxID=1314776 RepID=A0A166DQS8_9AGAM|nr:hypothetical protein SISSUDRAFT_1046556 [Sistotremastrum suecicum HHB10207 ss-3]
MSQSSDAPPIRERHMLAGIQVVPQDIREWNVGSPVTVSTSPLTTARVLVSTGSTTSIIDLRYLRLIGLLPYLVPLREGVDKVIFDSVIRGSDDDDDDGEGRTKVYGRAKVEVIFQGYKFLHDFWVIDIGLPVEVLLGNDWSRKFSVAYQFTEGGIKITRADAPRA